MDNLIDFVRENKVKIIVIIVAVVILFLMIKGLNKKEEPSSDVNSIAPVVVQTGEDRELDAEFTDADTDPFYIREIEEAETIE